MRPLSHDAHRPLIAAVRKLIGGGNDLAALASTIDHQPLTADIPPLLLVESLGCERWASATFIGQTHWLEVRLEGQIDAVLGACRALETQLGDAEFDVASNIVADVAVVVTAPVLRADGVAVCSLRLEILTIED